MAMIEASAQPRLLIPISLSSNNGGRSYEPEDEKNLSYIFGYAWTEYTKKVRIPWL